MQYKKTIHELKLHPHHSKILSDSEKDNKQVKSLQKREKELSDRLKAAEIERDSLVSSQQILK